MLVPLVRMARTTWIMPLLVGLPRARRDYLWNDGRRLDAGRPLEAVQHSTGEHMLFDLIEDPTEERNLLNDGAQRYVSASGSSPNRRDYAVDGLAPRQAGL